MDRGDTLADDESPRDPTEARDARSNDRPSRCGAMMQQRGGDGLQSSPQQFVRLVGGHRRPGPALSAPVVITG